MRLCEHDIFISDEQVTKDTALRYVAGHLVNAGNTTEGYLQGMLAREAQISTYLGNGIAIPHGTPETRDSVLNTGVKVIVFRHGVSWGEDNIAYAVIAIAARSNEHLDILRQLTHVLSNDEIPHAIKNANTPAEVLAILYGEHQPAEVVPDATPQGEQATFAINNPHGLHARPGAILVKVIKQFQSQITIENLDDPKGPVDGKNLMRVVSLGAKQGHRLHFTACGKDASQALSTIGAAVNGGLGEVTISSPQPPSSPPKSGRGWLSRLFG
ncbi:HPr family phosphocarrier protein [Superficieibacter sp. HKU1]|uniref:HPr family phosphocarrier protein n=1 Tax=Superficieibacter sp. HKU1 TaxID=3031919 RepID=UPI0023E2C048|nr:HPr family phosphocarrier protein [Superficieibacter sp. HKU1]WES67812.1 HPr family phosphocarrier protein [Superficieibacter sp. HKU1]